MVRWVIGSILHGGPTELFLIPANWLDWCKKGCGMCYPVCAMMHIKEPLLLIGKSIYIYIYTHTHTHIDRETETETETETERETEREREREGRGAVWNIMSIKSILMVMEGMFYLMIHSTHFIYGYRHLVKDTSDSRRGNLLLPQHGLLFLISRKEYFICTIPQTG